MTMQETPRGAALMARLVLVIAVILTVLGVARYGLSPDVFERIWHDMVERPEGPMSFRFLLQPAMAAIAATRDGIRDARTGRLPYFRTVMGDPSRRLGRLQETLLATARIILLGLGMDAIY